MSDDTFDNEQVPDESEQLDQIQEGDSLVERNVDDVLDEGVIAPDDWSPAQGYGNTAAEQEAGETIDQRIKQEIPDRGVDGLPEESTSNVDAVDPDAEWVDEEVGDTRAGRLVDADTDAGVDVESELVGDEVGIDGGAASAEEAAVHVIDEGEA
ncbi:DUF5709 domain-containing protein [Propionibacteriaceae bacterium Y1685]|uniref:DUF5709 domain-containing protein n=1 Tax=Microlunatus sp. Y1700 TaxID=3418487 RepID=UPI003B77D601